MRGIRGETCWRQSSAGDLLLQVVGHNGYHLRRDRTIRPTVVRPTRGELVTQTRAHVGVKVEQLSDLHQSRNATRDAPILGWRSELFQVPDDSRPGLAAIGAAQDGRLGALAVAHHQPARPRIHKGNVHGRVGDRDRVA